MKKLLFLMAMLPFFAQAQWVNGTFQFNSTSKQGRYFQGTEIDSLVFMNGAPVNGYVPVYNSTIKKSVWINPSTFSSSISFGTFGSSPNANGGNYAAGVITLQPAGISGA